MAADTGQFRLRQLREYLISVPSHVTCLLLDSKLLFRGVAVSVDHDLAFDIAKVHHYVLPVLVGGEIIDAVVRLKVLATAHYVVVRDVVWQSFARMMASARGFSLREALATLNGIVLIPLSSKVHGFVLSFAQDDSSIDLILTRCFVPV